MTIATDPISGREILLHEAFAYNGQYEAKVTGFRGTALAGVTTNIDFPIGVEDRHISGLKLILVNQAEADLVGLSIVDVDGVLSGVAYPPGTPLPVVLKTFGQTWNVDHEKSDQGQNSFNFVAKIMAGLYMRVAYVSTGATNVIVKLNTILFKKIA
jgi:hypothetical protein